MLFIEEAAENKLFAATSRFFEICNAGLTFVFF